MVKNLPAMQENWVWSLGWEDPLEKGMAIHSSILAWRIPYTEELGGLQSMGSQRVEHNGMTNTRTAFWERKPALHEIVSQIGFHVDFCSHPQSDHHHYCCGKEETKAGTCERGLSQVTRLVSGDLGPSPRNFWLPGRGSFFSTSTASPQPYTELGGQGRGQRKDLTFQQTCLLISAVVILLMENRPGRRREWEELPLISN